MNLRGRTPDVQGLVVIFMQVSAQGLFAFAQCRQSRVPRTYWLGRGGRRKPRRNCCRSWISVPFWPVRRLLDAAQAHGARYRGRRVGGLGHAAAFSFYPTKNLGAYGEGGALTTDDDQIARFVRAARNHGQTGRYEHEFVGYNYRMQGFQGAVLRIKLRRLYAWTERRQEIAREYRTRTGGRARRIAGRRSARRVCLSPVRDLRRQSQLFDRAARAREIETVIHYPQAGPLATCVFVARLPARHFPPRRARLRSRPQFARPSETDG